MLKNLFFILLVAILFTIQTVGQTAKPASTVWHKIENSDKRFFVAVPVNYTSFYDAKGRTFSTPKDFQRLRFETVKFTDFRSINAYAEGVSIFLETYNVKEAKRYLPLIIEAAKENDQTKDFELENFIGRQTIREGQDLSQMFFHLASDTQIFVIGAATRNKNNPAFQQFWSSLKLNNKNLLESGQNQTANLAIEKSVLLEQIQTSPLIERKVEEQPASQASDSSLITQKQSSSALMIWRKPSPIFTGEARRAETRGTVVLRITFSAEGQVINISVIKGLPNGLTEKSIESARRIGFLPAEKNNQFVSLTKTIEFNFNVY